MKPKIDLTTHCALCGKSLWQSSLYGHPPMPTANAYPVYEGDFQYTLICICTGRVSNPRIKP
jgi:hypothetical protein